MKISCVQRFSKSWKKRKNSETDTVYEYNTPKILRPFSEQLFRRNLTYAQRERKTQKERKIWKWNKLIKSIRFARRCLFKLPLFPLKRQRKQRKARTFRIFRDEKCENITRFYKKRGVLHTRVLCVQSNVIECCENPRKCLQRHECAGWYSPVQNTRFNINHAFDRRCWHDKFSSFTF